MFGKNAKFNIAGGFPYLTLTVLAVIFSVTFFLVFLSGLKQDRTTVSIMFIPKNEQSASQLNYVLENAARLPRMLAFYEKVLASNSNIEDIFKGLDADAKKQNWNKILESNREDGSSIVTLNIYSKAKNDSQILAEQSTKTLIETMSYYYNIKEEMDMRIVEGPLTETIIRGLWFLVFSSIIFGAIFSYLLLILSERMKDVISEKFTENRISLNLPKSIPKETDSMTETEKYDVSNIVSKAKVSGAPDNLPVFSMPEMPMSDNQELNQKEAAVASESAKTHEEPSEAEMKNRLNQLLRGGF